MHLYIYLSIHVACIFGSLYKRSYMVVNGACKHKDMQHFAKYIGDFKDVHMEYLSEQQLVALQVQYLMYS